MTAANMGTNQFPLLLIASDNEGGEVTPPAGGGNEGGNEGETTLTPAEIVEKAYALTGSATLNATLTGVISKVDTAYNAQYQNVTVTIIVENLITKPIMCYQLCGTGTDTIGVGDVITVSGTIKNFYGTIEFDKACTLDAIVTDAIVPAETKIALTKNEISLPTSVSAAGDIAIPTEGILYEDVTITWTSTSDYVVVSDGKLIVTLPNETKVINLVASLSCGQVTNEMEFTLTLSVVSENASWKMVTDLSQLTAGSKIVIAAKNADYAIGDNQKSNNREACTITKSNDTISFDEANIEVLTLVAGNKEGTFAFQTEEGTYLYAASKDSNYLRTTSTLDDNGSWAITIAEDGTASVVAQGDNTRNTLQYNPNAQNNAPLFACYKSATQEALCIYIYA